MVFPLINHLCGLYPVRVAMRYLCLAAVATLVVLIFIVDPTDSVGHEPAAEKQAKDDWSSLRSLRYKLESTVGGATHGIERSTSKKTRALFCGNAFTIPASKEVVTLRAQLSEQATGFCRIGLSDKQQVDKCREHDLEETTARRYERRHLVKILDRNCPVVSGREEADAQQSDARCFSGRGAFFRAQTSWGAYQKCIVFNIAEELRLKPGHVVLEWGVGCGHTLTLLKQLFDVDGVGVGVDAAPGSTFSAASATRWAQRHALGTFCHVAPREKTLEFTKGWFPKASWAANNNNNAGNPETSQILFDGVVSLAAVARLPTASERCRVLREVYTVLRPGSRAFIGGFGGIDDAMPEALWSDWMATCGIKSGDFDNLVQARKDLGAAHRSRSTGDEKVLEPALAATSFRPIREVGLFAGAGDHKAWNKVLLTDPHNAQRNQFEGSSYAIVLER